MKDLLCDLFPRPRLTTGALFDAGITADNSPPGRRCRCPYAAARLTILKPSSTARPQAGAFVPGRYYCDGLRAGCASATDTAV